MTESQPGESCPNCGGALQPTMLRCAGCGSHWRPQTLALVRRHAVRPPNAPLSLVYEPNGTAHDDVVFRLGDFVHRGDSYYFADDDSTGGDARRSLRLMCLQWKLLLVACPAAPVFLPFDFSDQSTRWLRCEFAGPEVRLTPGSSRREGWRVRPSGFLAAGTSLADFAPNEVAVSLPLVEALQAVDRSLDPLKARLGLTGKHVRRRVRLEHLVDRALDPQQEAFVRRGVGVFVCVHPMADETELLTRLRSSSEKCTKVDLYAAFGDDVHFVQIHGGADEVRLRGCTEDHEGWLNNFIVDIAATPIDRAAVHRALDQVAKHARSELGAQMERLD